MNIRNTPPPKTVFFLKFQILKKIMLKGAKFGFRVFSGDKNVERGRKKYFFEKIAHFWYFLGQNLKIFGFTRVYPV